jgi:hypothetical protein
MTIPYIDPEKEARARASVEGLAEKIGAVVVTRSLVSEKGHKPDSVSVVWHVSYWAIVTMHLEVDGVNYELVRLNFTPKSVGVRVIYPNKYRLFRLHGIELPVDRVFQWMEPILEKALADIERDYRVYLKEQA